MKNTSRKIRTCLVIPNVIAKTLQDGKCNKYTYPIELPVSLLRCWVDTNVGYDEVGQYLQMGDEKLYENDMVGDRLRRRFSITPIHYSSALFD